MDICEVMVDWLGGLDCDGLIDEAMSEKESLEFRRLLQNEVVSFRYRSDSGIKTVRGTLLGKYLPGGKYIPRQDFEHGRFVYWDLDDERFESFRWNDFLGKTK